MPTKGFDCLKKVSKKVNMIGLVGIYRKIVLLCPELVGKLGIAEDFFSICPNLIKIALGVHEIDGKWAWRHNFSAYAQTCLINAVEIKILNLQTMKPWRAINFEYKKV